MNRRKLSRSRAVLAVPVLGLLLLAAAVLPAGAGRIGQVPACSEQSDASGARPRTVVDPWRLVWMDDAH